MVLWVAIVRKLFPECWVQTISVLHLHETRMNERVLAGLHCGIPKTLSLYMYPRLYYFFSALRVTLTVS